MSTIWMIILIMDLGHRLKIRKLSNTIRKSELNGVKYLSILQVDLKMYFNYWFSLFISNFFKNNENLDD